MSNRVLCVFGKENELKKDMNPLHKNGLRIYNKECVIKWNVCLMFLWVSDKEDMTKSSKIRLNNFTVEDFHFLFDAVSVSFPPIFSQNLNLTFTFKKYSNIYDYEITHVNQHFRGALGIFIESPLEFAQGGNLIQCANGEFISVLSLDDGIVGCTNANATNEKQCEYRHTLSPNMCKHFAQRTNKKFRSSSTFYFDLELNDIKCRVSFSDSVKINNGEKSKGSNQFSKNKCKKVSRYGDHISPVLINGSKLIYPMEIVQKISDETNKFLCKSGIEIDILLVNDLVSDCGPENDDEFLLESQAEGFKFICSVEGQLPCFNGHNKCYNISEICTYKLNHFQHLIPCRTGQHLVNCANFECNMSWILLCTLGVCM